ncbi:hypothetical protein KC959_03945, partial [Candidatus Saccharibacteria bacterium]|nr:hypothetical protein [Candidatus Saccharibacteria bacterium]
AGVMGGADTEVDKTTKTIVIECATFDMYSIRRTSMRHGLFTDAVTRYNKGQSPLQNDRVLTYLMKCMGEATGAEQASDVYDIFQGASNQAVQVSKDKIRAVLGADISNKEIETLLSNVELQVDLSENDEDLCWITAPFWRMDIAIPEDIVEEVGRLYGYDKLPVVLPPRGSKPASKNIVREFSNSLRQSLREAGANEVLTYSFVHGDLMRHTGTDPEKWAYHLRNAISPDLQYYRTSLMPSLLAKVRPNVKAQAGRDDNEFALFEVGKVHVKGEFEANESNLPKQMRRLALVFAAEGKAAKNYEGSAYYQAKKYLDVITHGQATYLPLDTNEYPVAAPFQKGRAAVVQVNDQILGVVGEFNHRAASHLKLPVFCAGFEVDVDLLQEHLKADQYQQLSTFPSTNQDVTLEVDEKTSWAHVEELLHAELAVAKAEQGYWYEIEPLDIYQAEGSDKKRYSFRIELTHHEKTLKTDEVNNLLEALSKAAHENLGAVRI